MARVLLTNDDGSLYGAPAAWLKSVTPDPLRWQTSRAVDVTAKPRRDDTPTVSWAPSYATTLTSPVEYKPKGVGGGTKITGWNGQDDPVFQFFPGTYHTGFGGAEDLALFGEIKPGGASQAAGWPLVFSVNTSNTDTIEIGYQGGVTNHGVLVEVNGRFLDDSYMWTPSTITGSNCTLKLTFPTSKARHIRVWSMHNPGIVAVRVPTGASLTKPTTAGRTAAIIGDSFVNGSGTSNNYPDQGAWTNETFAPRLLRMLGYDRMLLAGIGGTGWTTANPYSDRIPVTLANNPDLLVFFGSVNDGTTNTGVKAAVASALASVASVPEVVVIPPVVAGDAFSSTSQQMREATEEAGRTFIDTGVFFAGTGKVGTPTGDGNRDYFIRPDGTHPTLDGHRALARYLFELMAS